MSAKAKELFDEIAEFRACSLARAVEIAAEVAMDAMEGRPINPAMLDQTLLLFGEAPIAGCVDPSGKKLVSAS